MHIGSKNGNHTYYMRGEPLQTVQEEKDIRVTISSYLTRTKHCKSACKKANTMLEFTARNFEYKMPGVMLTLYNSLVRPHIEDAAQVWSSNYKKDIELLERLQ